MVSKRYATELTNTSRAASTSLRSKVICHHMSSLSSHDFNYEVGLVKGRPAPRKSMRMILEALGLEDDGVEVLTSSDCKFNHLGSCRQNDVVLIQDGDGLRAARVQLHCAVAGECVTILQAFTHHRRVPGTALVVWRIQDGPSECWEPNAILAALEYCVYPDGTIGTLLPIEYR